MVKKAKGLETTLQGKQKIHLGFLFCFCFDAGDGTRGLTHCRPVLYHRGGRAGGGGGQGMGDKNDVCLDKSIFRG